MRPSTRNRGKLVSDDIEQKSCGGNTCKSVAANKNNVARYLGSSFISGKKASVMLFLDVHLHAKLIPQMHNYSSWSGPIDPLSTHGIDKIIRIAGLKTYQGNKQIYGHPSGHPALWLRSKSRTDISTSPSQLLVRENSIGRRNAYRSTTHIPSAADQNRAISSCSYHV